MKLKRTFTLLLALALCMSLAACGKTSADKGSGNATDVSTTGTDKYAIGEAFGTDSVECVIDEVKWVTLEDVTSHPSAYAMVGNVKQLEAKDMFPGYSFFGISALNDTMDYPCLVVTFSLKNIGKTDVAPTMDAENFTPYSEVPSYGNISVIYDDGYTVVGHALCGIARLRGLVRAICNPQVRTSRTTVCNDLGFRRIRIEGFFGKCLGDGQRLGGKIHLVLFNFRFHFHFLLFRLRNFVRIFERGELGNCFCKIIFSDGYFGRNLGFAHIVFLKLREGR